MYQLNWKIGLDFGNGHLICCHCIGLPFQFARPVKFSILANNSTGPKDHCQKDCRICPYMKTNASTRLYLSLVRKPDWKVSVYLISNFEIKFGINLCPR
jgi:hypothetical protein